MTTATQEAPEATKTGAPRPSARKMINVRVQRQHDAKSASFWEEYSIPYRANMNIISVLMDLREKPITRDGKKVLPISWDAACLEEVCGSCSMNINGVPRQACSALVDRLPDPIVLEPFKKFPVVRDLVIDRSSMFNNLKRVKAWVPIDGTYDLGEGPRMAEEERAEMYKLSQCMTCGCCVEACPQVNDHSDFIGPAAIAQARLFNAHPTGAMHATARLEALMGPGGVQACGKAQNCVRVCPKGIPLTESIFDMNAKVNRYAVKKFFRG
ncbi:MAG: succinate dehydrogenase iron-sulfur subunit [Candidatus Sumerlaeaceae bacterium]